eukprot:1310045-Pleurochrysis_carterae.AAC.1
MQVWLAVLKSVSAVVGVVLCALFYTSLLGCARAEVLADPCWHVLWCALLNAVLFAWWCARLAWHDAEWRQQRSASRRESN